MVVCVELLLQSYRCSSSVSNEQMSKFHFKLQTSQFYDVLLFSVSSC